MLYIYTYVCACVCVCVCVSYKATKKFVQNLRTSNTLHLIGCI